MLRGWLLLFELASSCWRWHLLGLQPDNLLPDSLKGLLIVVLTWRCHAQRLVVRR